MKLQMMFITKRVNKCLLLINQFKSEQKYVDSPLIKQTANEFIITHKRLIEKLMELDKFMQSYMTLSVQAASELGGGVLEQKILEQSAQMCKYSQMVKILKEDNETVIREIYSVLNSQQIRQPVRQLCTNTSEFKPDFN